MKKIVSIFCPLILIFCLSACSHIEDTNGEENFELNTLSDSDIINGTSVKANVVVQSFIINKGKLKISKLSGVKLVDTFNLFNEDLTIVFNTKVKSGNFKLVVIYNGRIDEIPINTTYEYKLENALGECIVKVAGESAKFELEYEYNKE